MFYKCPFDTIFTLTQEIEDFDNFCMAKTYFDLREYDRAAFFTEKCTSPKVSFLHLYAKYMVSSKKKNMYTIYIYIYSLLVSFQQIASKFSA